MSVNTRTALTVGTLAVALCVPLAVAGPAQAKGGGGDVRTSGSCSAGGTWKLKAKPDSGRVEIEFEVDTNRAGQVWAVRITDNGTLVRSTSATTVAPSGSFSVAARPANRAGVDTIRARATRGANVCAGVVQL